MRGGGRSCQVRRIWREAHRWKLLKVSYNPNTLYRHLEHDACTIRQKDMSTEIEGTPSVLKWEHEEISDADFELNDEVEDTARVAVRQKVGGGVCLPAPELIA